jgi:hypothetical protein
VKQMSEGQATEVETTPSAPMSEGQASADAGVSKPKAPAAWMRIGCNGCCSTRIYLRQAHGSGYLLLYSYQLVFLHSRCNGRKEIETGGGFCYPFAMLVMPHLLCLVPIYQPAAVSLSSPSLVE